MLTSALITAGGNVLTSHVKNTVGQYCIFLFVSVPRSICSSFFCCTNLPKLYAKIRWDTRINCMSLFLYLLWFAGQIHDTRKHCNSLVWMRSTHPQTPSFKDVCIFKGGGILLLTLIWNSTPEREACSSLWFYPQELIELGSGSMLELDTQSGEVHNITTRPNTRMDCVFVLN